MIFDEKSPRRVVVRVPAKLNLYLDVLGKRDDGYHEIETVMHTIDLFDTLTVERVDGDSIDFTVVGRPCPTDPSNLVVKAAEAFFSSGPHRFGLLVNLQKKIPLGAGLGGGSADAGGMLAAVNHLADWHLSKPELAKISATLGSDVPFFLTGGTAVARGRGELIEPVPTADSPQFTFVVVYPGHTVPTASVYGSLNLGLTIPKVDLRVFLQALGQSTKGSIPKFHNALAEPFRHEYPLLAELQDRISETTGSPFWVTGSGSAMFTVVESRDEGDDISRRLRAMAAGEAFVCKSLPGRPG